MDYRIGCDAHKHYSQFAVLDDEGRLLHQARVDHQPGAIRTFLEAHPNGTPVALESVGNWYWIADEIEAAGCLPLLTHAAKAKLMMGHVDKTDKLDARGLATLLHNGTLPTVWLPPGAVRDQRELPRTRMALVRIRTALKNRVHSTLAKYALAPEGEIDVFSQKGRTWLQADLGRLPAETALCLTQELELLDQVQAQIVTLEGRIRQAIEDTPAMQLLKTLPGVGNILAVVVEREVGSIERFPSAGHFASYAGATPTVHSSGGKTHYGRMRHQANQYLKWAFIEAANVVARHRTSPGWRSKHVVRLYERIRSRKGHAIAVGAVARHLAEATYSILKKGEAYRELPSSGRARA